MIRTPTDARRALGVDASADEATIRRAFRRLARRHHPDAGGDAATFQELQVAVSILLDRPDDTPRVMSPSTGRATRPSTSRRFADPSWGEARGRRWHEAEAHVAGVDWDLTLPPSPHPWSRDLLAVAAARPLDRTVLHPVGGLSRKPGSPLNRVAHWLSTDLMSRFRIHPSPEHGHAGHDVEIRLFFPPGKGRKRADDTSFPLGWTKERTPNSTRVRLIMPPSRDRRATAARAVAHLEEALDALDWPLEDWRATGES